MLQLTDGVRRIHTRQDYREEPDMFFTALYRIARATVEQEHTPETIALIGYKPSMQVERICTANTTTQTSYTFSTDGNEITVRVYKRLLEYL